MPTVAGLTNRCPEYESDFTRHAQVFGLQNEDGYD